MSEQKWWVDRQGSRTKPMTDKDVAYVAEINRMIREGDRPDIEEQA